MNSTIKWWGYVHADKSLHVKRYFGTRDLDDAYDSDFVRDVYGPWEVDSRAAALLKLKEQL
jgi:hypothetical protein